MYGFFLHTYIHILSFPQFCKAWLHENMEYVSVSVQYMQEQYIAPCQSLQIYRTCILF